MLPLKKEILIKEGRWFKHMQTLVRVNTIFQSTCLNSFTRCTVEGFGFLNKIFRYTYSHCLLHKTPHTTENRIHTERTTIGKHFLFTIFVRNVESTRHRNLVPLYGRRKTADIVLNLYVEPSCYFREQLKTMKIFLKQRDRKLRHMLNYKCFKRMAINFTPTLQPDIVADKNT